MRTNPDRWTFVALLASAWLVACSGDGSNSSNDAAIDSGVDQLEADALPDSEERGAEIAPDLRPDLPPPKLPELGTLTLYANLGDSIAHGYGSTVTYRDLLMQNDDDAYPEFEGKDFATRFSDIQLSDRSFDGATSAQVVQQSKLVPANTTGTTLVIISAGGNDILNNYTALLDPTKVKEISQQLNKNLELTKQTYSDESK
jgi:lysophospholipase L1-like esterase